MSTEGERFDYSAPDVPATVIADIAAEIKNDGKPPPLSEYEERNERWLDRQLYLAECRERDEQRRFEHEQRQAEQVEAARREAAIAAAQEREKAQAERREQINRAVRDREIADLTFQVQSHQAWQSGVQRAVRSTLAAQHQQALLADVERHFNPPPPPAEPEVIYVEAAEGSNQLGTSDFNPKLWMQKPRSWF